MISFRIPLSPSFFITSPSMDPPGRCQETPSIPRILPEAPAEPAGSGGCQRAMVITFIPIYINIMVYIMVYIYINYKYIYIMVKYVTNICVNKKLYNG